MSLVESYFSEAARDKMLSDAKAALHALIRDTLGPEVDDKVRPIVAEGTVYAEILQTAEAVNASLNVIGCTGPISRISCSAPMQIEWCCMPTVQSTS